MQQFADLVAGKSVALVGNASSILSRDDGARIDAHDVVVRFNLGLPGIVKHTVSLGRRTDIWVTAKWWGRRPTNAKLAVFMKLTAIGDRDWGRMQDETWTYPLIRWPQELADECIAYVKCDPGTGLRVLWWLKKKAKPLSVSLYGFDCWKTPSTWSGKLNTPNHSPGQEAIMVEKLCSE
jgi:hypothetical protein